MFSETDISTYNSNYTHRILDKFNSTLTNDSPIKNELIETINWYLNNGFILIGFKGTSSKIANSFLTKGVSINHSAGKHSGQNLGDGCYITPNFNSAVDYAKQAVRSFESQSNPALQTPPDSPVHAESEEEFVKKCELYSESVHTFEESTDCKQNMSIVLLFVKDFWNMLGCEPTDITSESNSHDYFEGNMMGWEIKFNKKQEIYEKLKVHSIKYLDLDNTALPDLFTNNTDRNKLAELPLPCQLLNHAPS